MIRGKNNYKAWEVSESEFPRGGSIEDKIKFLLRYGILAPSTHNTQPWKFKIENHYLYIFPDWNYKLPYADSTNRDLFISLGCCITNILSAISYFKFGYKITINDNLYNNPVIRISILENGKIHKNLSALFPFIVLRCSNKLHYIERKIDKKNIDYLKKSSFRDILISLVTDRFVIDNLANIHEQAILKFSKKKLFRRELASWLRFNNTKKGDGMPGFVVGSKPFQTIIGKFLIRLTPVIFKILARKDKSLLKGSAGVGAIASKNNSIVSWISVGRVFEEFALKATSLGISLTIMDAIIQDGSQIDKFTRNFPLNDMKPQLLFRIGYGKNTPFHTPRRSLSESIMGKSAELELANTIEVPVKIENIKIDNNVINYLVAGSGKPLVLIHGGNIGWGQWYPNIAALAKHFKVYAVDLLGGGRSSRIDFGKMDLELDLVDVIYKFIKKIDINQTYIVGSSIGGWIGLKLSLKKDLEIERLVLVDCIGFMDYVGFAQRILGLQFFAKFLASTILKPVRSNKNIERFLRDVFYNKNLSIKQQFIDYFYETMETSHNLLLMSRFSGFRGMRREFILRDFLHKIPSETLIIWGEKDKLMPLAKNVSNFKLIPKVEIKVIKDAGHIPSIEKSVEFNSVVLKFLRS